MTDEKDPPTTEQKFVLVFDFCSSTLIIEDLHRSELQIVWRNLLISVKEFLERERLIHDFEIYKFVGDGWILLFDLDYPPAYMFSLLKRLCEKYESLFKQTIRPVLSAPMGTIGITFGLDMGRLIRFIMNRQNEYIGRSINVAVRLQGAIKDQDPKPQGKILVSKPAYDRLRQVHHDYPNWTVKRSLRNISGNNNSINKLVKLQLYDSELK